ncbi:hypothetical protein [Leucobacter sp. G161]|uniref:hypothetical protein n=1 Tax=Leucobacter sp. G161 TaxID=663704 RepID=UPI00073E79DF|nr:hypothetical protein [Leucobacter sp. G161]
MSNPARELHAILVRWKAAIDATSRPTAERVRGSGFLSQTREAVSLLESVDAILDEWEAANRNVGIPRKRAAQWVKSVLAYPAGWDAPLDPERAFPEASLDALEMLADMIDMAQSVTPPLAADRVHELLAIIREALSADDTLDNDFRAYIEHLLAAVEHALEHRDAEALREDLQHLWIAVFAAEEFTENKGTWSSAATRFGRDTFAQTLASIVGGVATKMITGS